MGGEADRERRFDLAVSTEIRTDEGRTPLGFAAFFPFVNRQLAISDFIASSYDGCHLTPQAAQSSLPCAHNNLGAFEDGEFEPAQVWSALRFRQQCC